jgi:UDP-glucose 4-epimerase
MSEERFLVTGAVACIGVWVLRNLVREKVPVAAFDLEEKHERLSLILNDGEIAKIQFLQGDVSNYQAVENALKESRATRVIHLAALQLPFCKANPIS